ncbi:MULTISPECIES: CDP-glycerol glycerophosphotransferase family protein [unclassified Streptomyces]|uniref:bifunctional glycosyltransferase/CDP-glycerol:glycerophosphate glycerophosphotransferase n=1 Tax=unclassified Streptomyces TaxID=2593676 RepID=UPI00088D632A|nr:MULTISPECIES: CDP-glycerol glycerophosphotransferase family protein [unclassified Streptomyces]PBC82717.1 CDP-glycerol glycerophosphotransferase [Streptomyces sp. 2321.6]SDR47732.1 CDP-glycerol glycerophosphotransferase [Streptomyces sp. KS_16]SEC68933.1 CDP-glycerol glycerophosphotransferase [Streptomyces sp. 2133.1]SNC68793.1 CDP-glycerol glycerophosphotransferase [Streptomyces sp. 2114.4]
MKPRLTVVVPVHRIEGSERNVEECLESVAAQTLTDLDVVMVDDGPPAGGGGDALAARGGPAAPARRFAERDPRFRIVHHPGGPPAPGCGALRNTGARHAYPHTGYLAFLDADDVLLPRAYEDLVGLLDRSGADLATGNVYRLGAAGRSQSARHPATRATALRTRLRDDLTLLSDDFARNKVFRRTFWDKHQFTFPEGELCHDAAVTLPALFLADAVDVLREHVCYWRLPEGPDRHHRPDARGVRDRFAAVAGIRRFLADPAHARLRGYQRDYDRAQLTDGLLDLVEALPAAAPECRTAFLDCARDFLSGVDPRLFPTLPVELRMRWYLIRAGRLADLLTLLTHEARNPAGFAVAGPPLRKRAVLPLTPPLELPPGVTRLDRADFPVRARVREAEWRGGVLVLRGYAYIRNLDAATRHSYLRTAVLSCGRRRILLPLRPVAMPEATAESGQELHCYDWSGFELRLDPARLRKGGRWEESDWSVGVLLASAGVVRAAALHAAETGSGAAPCARELPGDGTGAVRITPWYPDGRLRLSVVRPARRLTGHRAAAGTLDLTVTTAGPPPTALRLTHQGTGTVVSFPVEAEPPAGTGPGPGARPGTGPGQANGAPGAAPPAVPGAVPRAPSPPLIFRIRLDALAAARPPRDGAPRAIPPVHTESWAAEVVLPGGGTDPIACDLALAPAAHPLPHGRELVVAAGPAGNLVLHDRTPQPYLDRALWRADGTLLVAGALPGAAPLATELVLKHGAHAAELAFPTTHDEGRFHATLPLGALPSLAGPLPLREGRWTLHLRERGAPGSALDAPVRALPSLLEGLPTTRTVRGKPLTLDRHRHDEALVVAGPALPATDRGPYRRRMLREQHYALHRSRPLRDTVLYSSFGGRAYGDSPRAVHEELVRRGMDVEHLWAVRDAQTAVPETARAVLVGSAEWHGALAHSRWVVTNTHLPRWFTRRGGQRIIQTWHGTPLKRIGADLAGTLCAGLAHLAPRPRVSRQWSVLLSPNAHSTPVLRSALGYSGRLLETGLPRTDAFFAADRDLRAAAVRERLGIEPGRKVVLYAPTPRDDLAYDAGHHRLHLPLDLELARRELADDHVLLVRSHPLVADRLPAHHAPFALDVSAHPDATELLLAADVLVTDYSSLAADFANTGRPMLFLTPDLPHYRDTLRGFTLDFEARVPGPLLTSTGELIDALGGLEEIAAAGADAYADFREAFCHRDDGGAAGRVADLMER